MPPNTLGNTGGPLDWFNELPKLSRTYALIVVAAAGCITWKLPIVMYLTLDWSRVMSGFEIWRLLTHVTLVGPFSFSLLINVMWILTYGATLERAVYHIKPEDFLFMFIFCTGALAALSFVLGPLLQFSFLVATGSSMIMALLYVWSKEFPEQDVKLYGIVRIKGFWLPFACLGLQMLMGQSFFAESLGIIVGHAWYFLTTLMPRGTGRTPLATPGWVRWLARKMELPVAPPPQEAQAHPSTEGFRAFGGRGRRLAG